MSNSMLSLGSNQTCTPGLHFNSSSGGSLRLSNPYGGIPENLLWNAVGWTALVAAFGLLRRLAGNYGLLGALQSETREGPWTQLFYNSGNSADPNRQRARRHWITSVLTLSEDSIEALCGRDASQYLSFQRHLILLCGVLTLSTLTLILPLNFSGSLQGGPDDFGHTTISNLTGDDPRLWAHVILAIAFLPLGLAVMKRFSDRVSGEEGENTRTLMLARVPRSYCSEGKITAFFSNRLPDAEIESICIGRDVSRLSSMEADWQRAREARIYCENTDMDLWVRSGSCWGPKVRGVDYYAKQEVLFYQSLFCAEAEAKSGSIGVAFVTFREGTNLRGVLSCLSGFRWSKSGLEKELKPWKWTIRAAPPPDDIIWENLDYDSHRTFILKMILVNLSLFSILFFFTSPAYILSQFQLFLKTLFGNKGGWGILPQKINDFIPTLFLWTLSALLPNVVAYSDWIMGHWRRSVENIWIMRKTFFYLLFMVLILPSIGLTSLLAFAQVFFGEAGGVRGFQWDCIFLPDSGAFFVNYVITSSLVGTAFELLRFSELFLYALRMGMARSGAEIASVRSANLYEFPFGYNYGWMLLIFALCTSYAVVCPLITPFALFYLIMKHTVDRYNLLYAYKRSKINRNIHFLAVNCVIVSLIFMQVVLLFFNILRTGPSGDPIGGDTLPVLWTPRAIFSITALSISLLVFLGNIAAHLFGGVGASAGSSSGGSVNAPGRSYMPPVLITERPAPPSYGPEASSNSISNYGTLEEPSTQTNSPIG